jgi:hypothetical protein
LDLQQLPVQPVPITTKVASWNPVHDLWQVMVSGFIPVSSTNKTHRHDITEILLKVALNTIHHKPQKQRIQ